MAKLHGLSLHSCTDDELDAIRHAAILYLTKQGVLPESALPSIHFAEGCLMLVCSALIGDADARPPTITLSAAALLEILPPNLRAKCTTIVQSNHVDTEPIALECVMPCAVPAWTWSELKCTVTGKIGKDREHWRPMVSRSSTSRELEAVDFEWIGDSEIVLKIPPLPFAEVRML